MKRIATRIIPALLALSVLCSAGAAQAATSGEWEVDGNYSAQMWNVNQAFCYLTHIQGKFEGFGEGIKVYVGPQGYWILQSWSQQPGVMARARCVTWDSFPGAAENHTFTAFPRLDYGTIYHTDVWSTDSICYMNLVSGKLSDVNHYVGTSRDDNDGKPMSIWYNHGFASWVDSVESGTFCAWLGKPPHLSPSYGVYASDGQDPAITDVPMIKANEGVCWLAGVEGIFKGGGEHAYIYADASGRWHLALLTQQVGTNALAYCAYFQP